MSDVRLGSLFWLIVLYEVIVYLQFHNFLAFRVSNHLHALSSSSGKSIYIFLVEVSEKLPLQKV